MLKLSHNTNKVLNYIVIYIVRFHKNIEIILLPITGNFSLCIEAGFSQIWSHIMLRYVHIPTYILCHLQQLKI